MPLVSFEVIDIFSSKNGKQKPVQHYKIRIPNLKKKIEPDILNPRV